MNFLKAVVFSLFGLIILSQCEELLQIALGLLFMAVTSIDTYTIRSYNWEFLIVCFYSVKNNNTKPIKY